MKTACLFLAIAITTCAPVLAEPGKAEMDAKPAWTISSDDCAAMNADGPDWLSCGFQHFAMNADGNRILTVSWDGKIQLWDEHGKELGLIDWHDEPSGASGYPNAHVLISGNKGLVVVHQNQLLVVDLMTTNVDAQSTATDLMQIKEIELLKDGRYIADTRDNDWKMASREIDMATAKLGPIVKNPGKATRAAPSAATVLKQANGQAFLTSHDGKRVLKVVALPQPEISKINEMDFDSNTGLALFVSP